MRENVPMEEAQEALLNLAVPRGETSVPLFQALNRVLCQDIRAADNIPPFDKSPLDGYALRATDTKKASMTYPARLTVLEEVRAGYMPGSKVVPGTAIRVMTGAPIPRGADVVIKYEDVKESTDYIEVCQPLRADTNIIRAGDDVTRGELVAARGTVITPPLVGLLASLGICEVPVFSKIRMAIVCTGDEIVDPRKTLTPGKIYNSNLYTLQASCAEMGAEPVVMGNVPDEIEAIAARITRSLEQADVVISTGGVSVGEYDVVKDALTSIGAKIVFWKMRIKPGSSIIAAIKNNKIIIGLSGNPAAAMISFDLIAVPILKKMMGQKKVLPGKVKAVFLDRFDKPSPQRRFLRARLYRKNGVDFVRLTGDQGNGVLKSMVACNILIDVPAGSGPLKAGQQVNCYIVGNINETYQEDLRDSLLQIAY
jgi:molybdopterin molybdotransferase